MKQITKQTTVRQILQQLGTGFGRSLSPNIWINAAFANYKKSGKNIKHPKGGHTIGSLGEYA